MGGTLRADQLKLTEEALITAPENVLICLHHQLVPVGSEWIDTMAIPNSDDFFAIIDRYDCVRGILWGHIHQTFEDHRRGVRLMGSPSTCVQFAPSADEFQVDCEPPGFRILALHADGLIESEVVRANCMPMGIQFASTGY